MAPQLTLLPRGHAPRPRLRPRLRAPLLMTPAALRVSHGSGGEDGGDLAAGAQHAGELGPLPAPALPGGRACRAPPRAPRPATHAAPPHTARTRAPARAWQPASPPRLPLPCARAPALPLAAGRRCAQEPAPELRVTRRRAVPVPSSPRPACRRRQRGIRCTPAWWRCLQRGTPAGPPNCERGKGPLVLVHALHNQSLHCIRLCCERCVS